MLLNSGVNRKVLPSVECISNWSVALYRKVEPSTSFHSYDTIQGSNVTQGSTSFYVQLQQHINTTTNRSDVLHFRYQSHRQKNTIDSYTFPFTVSQLSDMSLVPDMAPLASTLVASSRFYNAEHQTVRSNDQSDVTPTLLLRAKAFLGVLVINHATNSLTTNADGVIRPFLIFVTEETFLGQLFDAYIYRISQIATISMRDNPEDEADTAEIKKLFQGRCFYYATNVRPDPNRGKRYFNKPYDITLCSQRMVQGHDSDIRFFWNRGLCLPLLKYNIDIRNWIPKVICGGIEKYGGQNEVNMWLISRLSCERAGTRFNARGVNDDGAVANFVETEQIVIFPRQYIYSSFVIVRGSIPLFWYQPRFQVGTHRIDISRSETLSFKAFFEHFKSLYHHYGRVFIINLIEQHDNEKRIGEEYKKLFDLLVKTFQDKRKPQRSTPGHLSKDDFTWFEYHNQLRMVKNITAEEFVDKMLIKNYQYNINNMLERLSIFTYINDTTHNLQQGIFRINCIDCLDRTNNVQLAIGLNVLEMQLRSLGKSASIENVKHHLKEMWINNGDHISRIYTGTGALGQRSKAKDIQRSVGRAIQNNLRDDDKQQALQTLIYSYSKDSYLHERSVAGLSTPYVLSDGLILSEMYKIRRSYADKDRIRISIGTWNINGDKNPDLHHDYPSILDAWILNGAENTKLNMTTPYSISTIGYVASDYTKTMPDILAIGFQEICDLTAANMVWRSSFNASQWVKNVQNHFKTNYPNDQYILLGDDQLVGVCLAIFIRREHAPFVRNIAVDTVKTGMGGKLGNKGCVAIRLILHNTSICFICAHFTAGQNEYTERNKDYKTIMEKLSFPPPSRALWHDHVFFLGDFNYRLTLQRVTVEQLIANGDFKRLLEHDQLTKGNSERAAFQEFTEGQINFPPTYKYDIGSDRYDTSEKARIPSYTDRILWRSVSPNVETKLLYYGRADVKTSDHRPVSAIFDVEIEKCDDMRMYYEYANIYEKYFPSVGLVIYDMRADLNRKQGILIDEFDAYVRRKYGTDITIVDRFFVPSARCLSLYMFFEHGEHARRVMQPIEDELPSGIYFSKRLGTLNSDFAATQKLNILFADREETMYTESTSYDLGMYQEPAQDSLSAVPDVAMPGVASGDESLLLGMNDVDEIKQQQKQVDELISFDSNQYGTEDSLSNNKLQRQTSNTLFNENVFDPFHFAPKQPPNNNDDLISINQPPSNSVFYLDPYTNFGVSSAPQNKSSLNSFHGLSTNLVNNDNNHKTHSHISQQVPPQFIPMRPAPPVPIAPAFSLNTNVQRPSTLNNLNLNSFNDNNQHVTDLLDLGDPGSPPPSPTFDPYA